jgi:hypothetical protein
VCEISLMGQLGCHGQIMVTHTTYIRYLIFEGLQTHPQTIMHKTITARK